MDPSVIDSVEKIQTAVYVLILVGAIPAIGWAHSLRTALVDIRDILAAHSKDIAVLQVKVNHIETQVDKMSAR